jgi:hypothetical protein
MRKVINNATEKATDNTTEDDINITPALESAITKEWGNGKTPIEISRSVGQPVGVIYKVLRKIQIALTQK